MTRKTKLLFVCLGNICRSPTAEGVVRQMLKDRNINNVFTDSCGTGDWHIGKEPDSRAIEAMAKNGYDITDLRARQISLQDIKDFDMIFAMDRSNYHDLRAMTIGEDKSLNDKIMMFLQFLDNSSVDDAQEVPDPYYGGGFDSVFKMIKTASKNLVDSLDK